jgi:hypothetical protein
LSLSQLGPLSHSSCLEDVRQSNTYAIRSSRKEEQVENTFVQR